MPQPESPLKTFESASAEYYKALDVSHFSRHYALNLLALADLQDFTLAGYPVDAAQLHTSDSESSYITTYTDGESFIGVRPIEYDTCR